MLAPYEAPFPIGRYSMSWRSLLQALPKLIPW